MIPLYETKCQTFLYLSVVFNEEFYDYENY